MPAQLPQFSIDSDSQTYWEGLTQGELRIQRCDACSRHVFYPRALCPHCHSDQLSWVIATGKGTIYSYTVAHQVYGSYADEVPFIIAIVELEEGVRMMTRIVNSLRERVVVGAAVQVVFSPAGNGITLPYFRVITETNIS